MLLLVQTTVANLVVRCSGDNWGVMSVALVRYDCLEDYDVLPQALTPESLAF